jgi:hypothetical protein
MKGGLAKRREKGVTYRNAYGFGTRAPLKSVAQVGSRQHYLHQAKFFRDRSPFPHDTLQATANGEDWSIPASRERTEDSDLEADINLEPLGAETGCEEASR